MLIAYLYNKCNNNYNYKITKEEVVMEKVTYQIPAIHCGHCTHTIKMELEELEGVSNVVANLASKQIVVEYEAPATEEVIIGTLREINYPPELNK